MLHQFNGFFVGKVDVKLPVSSCTQLELKAKNIEVDNVTILNDIVEDNERHIIGEDTLHLVRIL